MSNTTAFLGACLLGAASVAHAGDDLSSLAGVDAAPLDSAELATVEGKGHGAFPLGALLLDRANDALLDTPAWTDQGLNPNLGPALGRAQVPSD